MTNREDPIVPQEMAGQWIAWTSDGARIVGAGPTPDEAEVAAHCAGIEQVILEWVPPADEELIGGVR